MEIKNIYLVLLLRIKAFTQHLLFKYMMVGNFRVLKCQGDKCIGAIAGSPMIAYDSASKQRWLDSASKQRWLDYHNQHESAALIGLFHVAFSVLPPVESYRNYRKPMQGADLYY